MNSQSSNNESNANKSDTPQPTKWWQWALVYPVFLTSIVAAVPTYIEAFKANQFKVPFGESSIAEEQNDMWETNLECTSAPLDPFVTSSNIKVDATICKSGDVLVKIFPPEGNPVYKWVGVNNILAKKSASFQLIKQAHASSVIEISLASASGTLVCQRQLGPGRLLRRISVAGGGCVDEVINTYTGTVVSSTPVSCDPHC